MDIFVKFCRVHVTIHVWNHLTHAILISRDENTGFFRVKYRIFQGVV
jgi:hypothetical protein